MSLRLSAQVFCDCVLFKQYAGTLACKGMLTNQVEGSAVCVIKSAVQVLVCVLQGWCQPVVAVAGNKREWYMVDRTRAWLQAQVCTVVEGSRGVCFLAGTPCICGNCLDPEFRQGCGAC
jgi:hypothetical protein